MCVIFTTCEERHTLRKYALIHIVQNMQSDPRSTAAASRGLDAFSEWLLKQSSWSGGSGAHLPSSETSLSKLIEKLLPNEEVCPYRWLALVHVFETASVALQGTVLSHFTVLPLYRRL